MLAGVVGGDPAKERERAKHRALTHAVTADADGQHGDGVGDGHGERDIDEWERQAGTAGEEPDGDEVEEPDDVARRERGDERAASGARTAQDIGERGGASFAEPVSEPGGRAAADNGEGNAARDRKHRTEGEQQAQLGVVRDGFQFQEQREGGEAQEDDEAQHAVEEGGGEAGGALGGVVAADVEGTGGIAAQPAEQESVVEISDPRDDVRPVERPREVLRAQEQPPAPGVQGKREAGDERGEGDGGQGKLTAETGELAPVNIPDEGGNEQGGERVAREATGRGVEKGGEAAHDGGVSLLAGDATSRRVGHRLQAGSSTHSCNQTNT